MALTTAGKRRIIELHVHRLTRRTMVEHTLQTVGDVVGYGNTSNTGKTIGGAACRHRTTPDEADQLLELRHSLAASLMTLRVAVGCSDCF